MSRRVLLWLVLMVTLPQGRGFGLHECVPEDEQCAPNDVQLPASVAGEEGILVKAHVDPSLLVVEPVCDVPGLDVFDPSTEAWVSIERASKTPASEFVVFGGRCLEAVTKGRIKACLHRVTSSDYGHAASRPGEENEGRRAPPRFCFIFEQKLGDFFEAA